MDGSPNELDLRARLAVHEQVCAERYGQIIARVGRLETILLWATGSLILGMGGLIVTLALKLGAHA